MVSDGVIKTEKELELTMDFQERAHKLKMEALEYIRKTEKLKHDWEMERFRIRNAEQKRLEQMRAVNRGRN